jgi:1,4-alpha-glucan branching enzyme
VTELSPEGVTFRFYRPNVSTVCVAGTFNDWQQDATPMIDAGEGWWTLTLNLPPGDYQFRYVADGAWFTDQASHGVERTHLGWNSVLVVPGLRRRLAA